MRTLRLVGIIFDVISFAYLSLVLLSLYFFPTVFILRMILIGFVVALIGFAKDRLWKYRLFWLLFLILLPPSFLKMTGPGPIREQLDTVTFLLTGFLTSISAVLVWRLIKLASSLRRASKR